MIDAAVVRIMKTRKTLQHQVRTLYVFAFGGHSDSVCVLKPHDILSFPPLPSLPQELIQETFKMLVFFRPDVRKTKQRIEHLIKEGYMRREDPSSHTSPYVYVADEAAAWSVCVVIVAAAALSVADAWLLGGLDQNTMRRLTVLCWAVWVCLVFRYVAGTSGEE